VGTKDSSSETSAHFWRYIAFTLVMKSKLTSWLSSL
jgi:hypothetical protein